MRERKTFTFDGENSADYGLYISGDSVYNAPNREIDMISIPGRNGQLAIDMGRYENITVTYPAFVFADTQEEFREKIRRIRNWLCSKTSYQRLTDEYNPESFRLGLYKSGLEVEPIFYNRCGEFEMSFDCKPQRFLFTGEEVFTLGEWGETETYSGSIVSFEGTETTAIKSLVADIEPIQDLNGQPNPYPPGGGVNKWDEEWQLGYITPSTGDYSPRSDRICTKNYIPVLPDTAYYFKDPSPTYMTAVWYDENQVRIRNNSPHNEVITSPSNARYLRFSMPSEYGTTYKNDVSINYPSTDHNYHPYSNICPISGWSSVNVTSIGKNFIPKGENKTQSGVTFTVNDDGSISLSGTASATVNVNLVSGISLKEGEYKYCDFAIGTFPSNSSSRTQILSTTWTSYNLWTENNEPSTATRSGRLYEANNYVLRIRLVSGHNYNGCIIKPMLIASTDSMTDYEPYEGNTYPISLGQTVYGGEIDVVSGEGSNEMAIVDLGSLNWTYNAQYHAFYTLGLASTIKKGSGIKADILCSVYPVDNDADPFDRNKIISSTTVWAEGNIVVVDDGYTSATDFKTAMNGVQLVYELATPIEVTLTPTEVSTLLGQNNIFADSGDVTVEIGENPYVLVNPTKFEATPIFEVEGSGTLSVGDTSLTINNEGTTIIDTEMMEAYEDDNGAIISRNDDVEGGFPTLTSGINNVEADGLTSVKITPKWWEL